MIEELATVTACEGGVAEVQAQRRSACGDCAASNGCGVKALAGVIGNRRMVIRVLNPIGARPGEQVVIGLGESVITKASLASYLMPLAGLFLFALLGREIGLWLDIASEELLSIAGGLSGLLLGFGWLRRFSERLRQDARYQAVILRHAGTAEIPFRTRTP